MDAENGAPPTELPEHIPQQLGRYRLVRAIGKGGMGMVFEAIHVPLQRKVALKVLRRSLADDHHFLQRFERELKALGKKFDTTHVILATDGGEEAGIPFLAMEFVEGLNLDQLLKQRGGKLTAGEACELMRQAALGLDAIHQQNLVHRDLKPTNLMLTHDGIVKILDLGLVRLQEVDEELSELTPTYGVLGTVDYQAPEQAANARRADIRSDIYSLGCTMFKLLTGASPYANLERYQKAAAHALAPIPELPAAVAPEVAAIVRKMLAKKPEDRYQTPRDVAAALAPLATQTLAADVTQDAPRAETAPTPAPVASAATTMPGAPDLTPVGSRTEVATEAPPRRRRWAIMLGGVLLVLVLAPGTYFLRNAFERTIPSPERPATLDHLPLRQANYLLDHEPVKALWDPKSGLATYHFDAKERLLTATTAAGEHSLFHLGQVSSPSYEIQVRYFQPVWRAGFGIYFGYNKLPSPLPVPGGEVIAEFQMIHLQEAVANPDDPALELHLTRSLCQHVRKSDGTQVVERRDQFSQVLPEIRNERSLTLSVADYRLESVFVGRETVLKNLVSPQANKNYGADRYKGHIGLWICGTSAVVRDAEFRLLKK